MKVSDLVAVLMTCPQDGVVTVSYDSMVCTCDLEADQIVIITGERNALYERKFPEVRLCAMRGEEIADELEFRELVGTQLSA